MYIDDHLTTLNWTIVKAHLDLCQTYLGQNVAAERGNVKVGLIWGHKLLFFTAEDVAIAVLSTKSLETRLIDREHCCPECFCCSLQNMSAAPKKELQNINPWKLQSQSALSKCLKKNSRICIQNSFEHSIQIHQTRTFKVQIILPNGEWNISTCAQRKSLWFFFV